MGQKVNPIGLRLGIIRGWDSNWYGGKDYGDKLAEDEKIRKYLRVRIPKGGIAKVVIERTLKRITLTIHTSRPGIVIGKGGGEVDAIREEIKKITGKDVQINISEIKRPELDARLVGENIAQQIENRFSYKRAIKNAIQGTMKMGADGIKVRISGRLNGGEIARSEMYKERSNIDYALVEAQTVYGKIGIKVWLCKGEIYGKVDLAPQVETERRGNNSGGGRNDRRDRGGRDDRNRGNNNRPRRNNA
jgi:small subunit ribosomal protein S3